MKTTDTLIFMLALGVGWAFCAYLDPRNVRRWAILMNLCQ